MTADGPGPEPDNPVARLLSMRGAVRGHYTAPSQPGDPSAAHARELGRCMGEILHRLAATGTALTAPMEGRQRTELAEAVSLEWINRSRDLEPQHALQTLSFLGSLLHAAIDGARFAGCDVGEAHDLALQLEEVLVACAEGSGIVEGFTQMLSELARGED